jgi:deoxycytidylate deaminase
MIDQLVSLARCHIDKPDSGQRHFSFILNKRHIVSMGWNRGFQTHPLAARYGHRFNSIHAELDAIRRAVIYPKDFRNCTMINIRIKRDGSLGLARPCRACQKMLRDFQFKKILYSNNEGSFISCKV